MMKRVALIASLFLVMSASYANAEVTYTVETTTGNGNPLNAMDMGETLTIDVFLRSDGEAVFGLGASVFGYDGALTYVSGTTSETFLNQAATGPGTGFGGLPNTLGSDPTETPFENDEIQFLNGISPSGTPATGADDISPIDQMAGGAHARMVFTVNETVTFTVGTSSDYADAVIGNGGAELAVNNSVIAVTVPEPGTIVSSMAALGSVFAVVGLRRRG